MRQESNAFRRQPELVPAAAVRYRSRPWAGTFILTGGLAALALGIGISVSFGAAVSVAGSIGFVGLIVSHLTRKLVGVDYRWIIPCSAVLASLLVVFADLAARMVHPPYETPLGALIALLGVPFFLYLARKERREL